MTASVLTGARYIYEKLRDDNTIHNTVADRIYDDEAPAGAAMPYIIIATMNPAKPFRAVGNNVIWWDELTVVKAVGAGAYSDLESLVNRIRAVLHNTRGTTSTGGSVIACYEDGEGVRFPEENDDGTAPRHLGITLTLKTQ